MTARKVVLGVFFRCFNIVYCYISLRALLPPSNSKNISKRVETIKFHNFHFFTSIYCWTLHFGENPLRRSTLLLCNSYFGIYYLLKLAIFNFLPLLLSDSAIEITSSSTVASRFLLSDEYWSRSFC